MLREKYSPREMIVPSKEVLLGNLGYEEECVSVLNITKEYVEPENFGIFCMRQHFIDECISSYGSLPKDDDFRINDMCYDNFLNYWNTFSSEEIMFDSMKYGCYEPPSLRNRTKQECTKYTLVRKP